MQARSDYEIDPHYSKKKIGDREFDVMRMTTRGITQLYCCTIIKRFAVVMNLTFEDDEQEEKLTGMLRGIKLK
jgi:hypothetical protein